MNVLTALETLTVPELRKLAAEVNLTGRSRLRKAELIAALAENPVTETLVAIRDLPSLRPEATAAEAGGSADPELRAAEVAEANGEPLPLTRRQAEHLVVIDQQRGDVPDDEGGLDFSREAWLNRAILVAEERWLDAPGANALSDAYRIVMGLMAPRDVTATPREQLIEAGLAEELQASPTPRSGYTDCECRDCFDITIGGSVCHHCEEAGCSDDGDQECYRDDAYQG